MEGEVFVKTSVEEELPQESGKYMVFTKSTSKVQLPSSGNQFACRLTVREDDKGKLHHSWDCSNQVVTHWLKAVEYNHFMPRG